MPVTGTVYVDLNTPGDLTERRTWFELEATPDGGKIIVFVGDTAPAWRLEVLRYLRDHVERLNVDVRGDARTVRQWYDALTSGQLFGTDIA